MAFHTCLRSLLFAAFIIGTLSQIVLPLPDVLVPTRYTKSAALDGTLTMYWTVDTVAAEIEVCLVGNNKGFVAWGMSHSGYMVNSDVYIGWVVNGVPQAYDYTIGSNRIFGKANNGVDQDTNYGTTNNLLYFNGSETSAGVTTMIFVRKLVTGDSADIDIVNGNLNLIYAWHATVDGPNLVQHTVTPNPGNINFFSGAVTISKRTVLMAHGSMMFIAWVFLAPVGFILARFLKKYKWWFPAHIAFMTSAVAFVIIGFGLAIKGSNGSHFKTVHQIIGLIVTIVAFVQPFIGILADKLYNPDRKGIPIFPDKVHWVAGWLVITLGMINIALGLRDYGAPASGNLLTAYSVIISVIWAVGVTLCIVQVAKGTSK